MAKQAIGILETIGLVALVQGTDAMLKAASANGWLDYDKAVMEMMLAFKRAGCDGVLTYAACDVARMLKS